MLLSSLGALLSYTAAWPRAIGSEVRLPCVFADLVRGSHPDDWARLFGLVNALQADGEFSTERAALAGVRGMKLYGEYRLKKFGYRKNRYAQIREDEYVV